MEKNCNKVNIFVVIPNKNGMFHLSYSLPLLEKSTYPNYSIILIDDCSTDDSVNFVGEHYPCVTVLTNNRKKGFAGAVNTGIIYALERGADYIAVFNSDIKVLPEWMDLVVHGFKNQEKVGLIGFTEVLKEYEDLYYSWNIRSEVKYKKVNGLPGCLYLCSSKVFRHIGLFDEGYYMYGEDNDFFARLRKIGYKILQTNVPVWHYGEGSSGSHKFFITWLAYRNALRFAIKNETPLKIIRLVLSLINQGCNPLLLNKNNDPNYKRLRRYNIGINFILILGSCLWNIINIFSTLRVRNGIKDDLKKRLVDNIE
ncbi:MAG: glycosyltransferase [Proteobacteria bacterium]|nr:glycosyltransferase [Pseudomonadota bacterium]MBU1585760.1 glycosyltransferase [Pseudomonadota bacterium]MBU2452670.1 glycosyltransferase [Pseudomonadota bacterium]MBU2631391.1 glycosyltransferase [Pseudomonadota bacterium]